MMPSVRLESCELIVVARRSAGAPLERRPRDPASEVDHEAERQLGNAGSEAGARARHQDAVCRGGGDIDAARVDMAVDIRDEVGAAAKKSASAPASMSPTMIEQPFGRGGERSAQQRSAGRVETHLIERAEAGERLIGVVEPPLLVGMRREGSCGGKP